MSQEFSHSYLSTVLLFLECSSRRAGPPSVLLTENFHRGTTGNHFCLSSRASKLSGPPRFKIKLSENHLFQQFDDQE